MISEVKKSVVEKGILSSPNRKSGKILHQDVVQQVLHFYESQEISREMPGVAPLSARVRLSTN